MKTEDSLKKLREEIKNHRPLTINFGKGVISGNDVKEQIYWDDSSKHYQGVMGFWSVEFLIEVAKGYVDDTTIEFEGEQDES